MSSNIAPSKAVHPSDTRSEGDKNMGFHEKEREGIYEDLTASEDVYLD